LSGYILATLTKEQREAVIGAVCPWCKHKIGITYRTTVNGCDATHYIDGHTTPCKAHPLREAIYSADRAVEAQVERDRELLEYIA
jgi:hypothetical protein